MRGTIELILAMVILLAFALVVILGQTFLTNMKTTAGPMLNPTANSILDNVITGFYTFDTGFLILTAGLFLALLVSAFYIQTNPVFFIVFLIMLILDVFFSPTISNIFLEFGANPSVSGVVNNYPMIIQVFQNLPVIILVFGVLTMVILYARRQGAQ